MAQPGEVAVHLHTWIEIAVALGGFGGIILTSWRSSIGVKNEVGNVKKEVGRLADEIGSLNGKAVALSERQQRLEVRCAGYHGAPVTGFRHVQREPPR